ncbi:MAG: serine protease [Thermoanaerobaculia bacterium]
MRRIEPISRLALLASVLTLAGVARADAQPAAPALVGELRALDLAPDLAGAGRLRGRSLWRDVVAISGASFLRLHFADFDLLPGDSLKLSTGTDRLVERLSGTGPRGRREFWALAAFDDTLVLELEFQAPYARPPFRVDRVAVGDLAPFAVETDAGRSICPPDDLHDAICASGDPGSWANVLASAGVLGVGGDPGAALFCSGANVSPANYVLTNEHCIPGILTCAESEFVFGYRRIACDTGATVATDWVSFRCGETVTSSPAGDCDAPLAALDFSLSSVDGDPASAFGWASPDPTPLVDGEAITIVQQPAGGPQMLASGSGAQVDVDTTDPGRSVLRYYGTLDTDDGSSGAPIFRAADHRVVGLHHCGGCEIPGVGNRGVLMADIYPAIAPYLCTPGVLLEPAGVEALQQVEGNGDAVPDPGETWSFRPRVRNRSCVTPAESVVATFGVGAGSPPGVELLDGGASFGDLAAGASAAADLPLRFRLAPGFPCGGEAAIDLLELSADTGAAFGPYAGVIAERSGYDVQIPLPAESFALGIPADWTIVDGGTGGGVAATWTAANPGGRTLDLEPPFAIVDSDEAGPGAMQDEMLVSPILDAEAAGPAARVFLEFRHDFRWSSGGLDEKGDVELRPANGGAWRSVTRYSGASSAGAVRLDLTDILGPTRHFALRFRYHDASYEWWWAIDDPRLIADLGPSCHPWTAAQIFTDDFEWGAATRWSASAP